MDHRDTVGGRRESATDGGPVTTHAFVGFEVGGQWEFPATPTPTTAPILPKSLSVHGALR